MSDAIQIEKLQNMIDESSKIVFFGGAGVSTESGIPDFRSVDGLYHQKYEYPPETILSHTFFVHHTEEFYRFYHDKMLCLDAKPNNAHKKLAELEKAGKLSAIVTQNIDGLHQIAGSKKVLELHGSMIKPDVVLYEECLDDHVMSEAIYEIGHADMLIIGGTSLVVYPAAGLIHYYRGKKLVLINKSATSQDRNANLVIQGNIGEVLKEIKVR